MGYVFVSYSSKNRIEADALRALMQKKGIECWMAPYDIPSGQKYASVITKALKDCSCLLLLLTKASQESVWVPKEVERAVTYRKVIIPIQLESVVLNEEFELYVSNEQILTVPQINEKNMQVVLNSIYPLCGIKPKNKILDFDMNPKGQLVCYKELSRNYSSTQNMILEGENENSIKHLLKTHAEKADVIYMDPPFNSNKMFVEHDEIEDEWSTMMMQRLKMARSLVSASGIVFISIDDNEDYKLKHICHEIFGEDNFAGTIILANYKKSISGKFVGKSHEYILVYSKSRLMEIKQSISSVWDASDIGDSNSATKEVKKLLGNNHIRLTGRPVALLKKLISIASDKESLIIDLYSRSGAVAQGVMELNGEDEGQRRYILVQGTENIYGDEEQAQIIRTRVSQSVEDIQKKSNAEFDSGFRVYKIDTR